MIDVQHHTERPVWRGVLHTWTFWTAIPAAVLLVGAANSAAARVSVAIYGASVLALFGTSAAYHRLARTPEARAVMQRLDHAMIFVLIAGTYTPICLVALPLAWGIPVLSVVWTAAIGGVVLKLVGAARVRRYATALYPVIGWTAIVALPAMWVHLSTLQLVLVVAGGVLYTIGIPVLVRKRPDPWPRVFGYHEIWHGFTVAAGGCHFAAVTLLVR
jgi:hemolysin III